MREPARGEPPHATLQEALKIFVPGAVPSQDRETLLAAFHARIRLHAAKYHFQEPDLDDLIQLVSIRVFQGLGTVRDSSEPTLDAWLATIVHREAERLARRLERHPALNLDALVQVGKEPPAADAGPASHGKEPSRTAVAAECLVELRPALGTVTYEAFMRHAVEKQPVADVAADLNVTPRSVSDRCSRVRTKLREKMAQRDARTSPSHSQDP